MFVNEIQEAVRALKAGHAVVFPTDTVCGLGVAPRYARSLQEVYHLKRRPSNKPVAWLVGSVDDLDRYGADVSEEARRLVADGWPGALTVIVKASEEVPEAFRSSRGTIGLRMPASDASLALIRAVGPLATSSANRAGGEPPRSLEEVDPELLAEVAARTFTGEMGAGTASRVVDATGSVPVVLRA